MASKNKSVAIKCPPGKKLVGGKCITKAEARKGKIDRHRKLKKSQLVQRIEKPVAGGVTFR